jgi:RNA polymerase sigma-70 factor, ECF subfamily
MDDLILVESSQAGNKAAFDSLIDRYYKSIYCFAFQYAGSHHEADEVCQEAFLRAFEKIRALKDGNCFRGWVLAINVYRKPAF